nr:MVI11 [Larix kaempferi]
MGISKSYEEARQQRLEENKKRMEDLGLSKLSEGLQAVVSASKSQKRQVIKPRRLKDEEGLPLERRCSSRVSRLPTPIYRELDDFPRHRKSYGRKQNGRNQVVHNIKLASYEARMQAMQNAEKIVEDLGSKHPSFIKSLVRSHVSSCFWLGLPTDFCRKYLPRKGTSMVLEDEKGDECDTVFIALRTGLSGGWKGFALDHNLDDGDALVFELVEPTRFKVHVTKAKDYEPVTKEKFPSENGDLQKESSTTNAKNPPKKSSKGKEGDKKPPLQKKTANSKATVKQNLSNSGKGESTMLKSEKENESKITVPASASLVSNTAVSQLADKVNNGSDHREETNTRKAKRGRLE